MPSENKKPDPFENMAFAAPRSLHRAVNQFLLDVNAARDLRGLSKVKKFELLIYGLKQLVAMNAAVVSKELP